MLLLGHEHDAETAFADLLQQPVAADEGARGRHRLRRFGRRAEAHATQTLFLVVGAQQFLDPLQQGRVVPAGAAEVFRALPR